VQGRGIWARHRPVFGHQQRSALPPPSGPAKDYQPRQSSSRRADRSGWFRQDCAEYGRVEKCPFASGGMDSERPTTAGQADQLIGVVVGQKDVSEVLDA